MSCSSMLLNAVQLCSATTCSLLCGQSSLAVGSSACGTLLRMPDASGKVPAFY